MIYAMLCHTMHCHAMSCHTTCCHAMRCHAMHSAVMQCNIMRGPVMRCAVMQCTVLLCNVLSCNATSCNVLSYNAPTKRLVWANPSKWLQNLNGPQWGLKCSSIQPQNGLACHSMAQRMFRKKKWGTFLRIFARQTSHFLLGMPSTGKLKNHTFYVNFLKMASMFFLFFWWKPYIPSKSTQKQIHV